MKIQLSVVPETGITKLLFISSVNYNFKQKLMGLLNDQIRSTLSFCLVIPTLGPYGKCNFTFIPATSSTNWYFKLQFSYPSLIILKDEWVSIPKGTTGIITSLLLKKMLGNEAEPLKTTSTYLSGSSIFLDWMKSGSLWKYYPTI